MTVFLFNTLKAKMTLRSRRLLITVAIVTLIAAGLLTAIPFAVRHVATSWLLENGMSEARIANIDINPFTGRVAIEGVELVARSGERSSLGRFAVNLALTELVKKHIRIQSVEMRGLNLVIDQSDTLSLGGLQLPATKTTSEAPTAPVENLQEIPEEAPPTPWLFGVDAIRITDTALAFSIPKLALRLDLDELSLTTLHAWIPDHEARLEIKGAIDQSPLLISLDLTPFAQAPSVRGGIQLKGFSLNRLHRMAEPHVTALRGELTVDTRIAITHDPKSGTTISQTGTLSLLNLGGSLAAQGVDLSAFDLSWLGDLWVAMDPQGTLIDLRSLGRLANTRLTSTLPAMGIGLHHEGLVWDGEMRMQPLLKESLAARGNISLSYASARDLQSGEMLAGLSNLFVYDLKARGLDTIRTPHISLKGIDALPPLAHIGALNLTGIALRDLRHLHAETLVLNDVATTFERNAAGQFASIETGKALAPAAKKESDPPLASEAPGAVPDQTVEAATTPVTVEIETFRVEGEKFLRFSDQSVTPAFSKTINLKRFELLDINSADPEQEIPLILETELDPYETITIKGTLRPFAPDMTAHLGVNITNFDLAPLSPYSAQAIGYLVETGTFTTETKLDINAGILDVTNQLTLHNVELVPEDKEKIDQVMKTLTMPLDFALSILKDKNNTISLAIPVTGPVHDPDVSLQSIINKAMAKAVTLASVSYLKFLIQPYGAILTVAEKAGEYATRIRLDSVPFEVGSVLPSQPGLDYLKVVAGLMTEKKVLKLTVCANAVPEDVPPAPLPEGSDVPPPAELDEAPFLELARQRANAIRDVLLAEGISPSRIILCHPHFTVTEQTSPEAMLTL